MNTEKREKIIDVFSSVLELSDEERTAFINEEFGDDKNAIDEIRELLKSHIDANEFLEESPAQLLNENLSKENDLKPSDQVGVYKIENEIGSGGMGRVYLASRADKQFEQKVAIKVLKRGMDTEKIVERFKYERQILADLNHPNIAKLLDGGTTQDGLPYFVLEYIEGVTITQYCHKNNISLEARLNLFRQVCDAVSYAHQNLIVHRDIKPNNILVTNDGTPKLLDFGIAKVLETNSDKTTLTIAGERLMTPKYASPEQIKGEQITTSTDIYSLGVLFYEILTGNLPYKFATKSPHEVGQIICEQEPTLPSRVQSLEFSVQSFSTVKTTLENENAETNEITEERKNNSKLQTLNSKLFRGDLDNIALMTLEKEPSERYGSVDDFSSDIEKYLKGLPVIARKHTPFYRGAKFVKRHKIGVAFAGIIAALLIGFVINSQVQANRIAKERDRSEKVLAFMSEIFEGNDPANAKGKEVSARELLDQGVEKINELDEQPDVQAALMISVGKVYRSLGVFDKAEDLFKQSLQINKDYFGEESAEVAESLLRFGDMQRVRADFGESEKTLQRSMKIRQDLFGRESAEYLESTKFLITMYLMEKNWAKAEEFGVQRYDLSSNFYGEGSVETIDSLNDLVEVYLKKDEVEKSLDAGRKAVEQSRNSFDKPNDEWIKAKVALAKTLYIKKKEYVEAKRLLEEAEKMHIELNGKIHPKILETKNLKAVMFGEQNKFEQAVKESDEIIDIAKKLYNGKHTVIARYVNLKASFLFQSGNYNEAEKFFKEALEIRRNTVGDEHPEFTATLSNLALVQYELGDYKIAAENFDKSVKTQRKVMKSDDPQIGFSLIGLGKSLASDGETDKAELLISEGVEFLKNSYFKNTWYHFEAENILGQCLYLQGNYAKAEPILLKTYEQLNEATGKDHRATIRAKEYLAKLYKATGDKNKAEKYK